MNVFIPSKKDANPFFDEIMFHSKNTFVFDNYKNYNPSFKVVLIHWPEQLFDWNEPTIENLVELKNEIKLWKKHAKIIYVVHNLERHYGMTPQYTALYNLIESNCSFMVHFGKYSCALFKFKFPSIVHKVIQHPLYKKSFEIYDKSYAREHLNIGKNEVVIIAPGSIRNIEERKMILKLFKNIPQKNKVLIVPRMYWVRFKHEFKGRALLKKVFDVKKIYETYINKKKYKNSQYKLGYQFLKNEELSLLMSAADIVFIPRIKILNSGNVFLGLTYKKIIVGPRVGNITEVLDMFEFPSFEPNNSKSIRKALNEALKMDRSKEKCYNNDSFKPIVIAKQWDDFLMDVIIGY